MDVFSYDIDKSFLISELGKLRFENKKFVSGSFDAFHEILRINFQCCSFGDLDEEIVYWMTFCISSEGITWDYNSNIGNDKWKKDSDNGGNLSWKFIEFLKNQWLHNNLFVAIKLKTTTADLFSFPANDLPIISLQDFKIKFRTAWCDQSVILLRLNDGKLCYCNPDLQNEKEDTLSFLQENITMDYDSYSKEFAIVSIYGSKFVDFANANFDGEKFDMNFKTSKHTRPVYRGGFSNSEYFSNEMHPDYDNAKAKHDIDRAFNGDD